MAATKAILSMSQWAFVELGLENVFEFVVMATRDDLDANAEFIRLADTYVEVPAGKNSNNYANVDLICKTAVAQNVDAVWPGWGHASENPKLPKQLSELGIIFIGPTSPVMSVLGDKIAANILAQTAGVPSIPWSGDGLQAELTEEGTIPDATFQKGTIHSVEEAIDCADRIGYPVMLKASEGGGGKGIRMCNSKSELEMAYPQVLAEQPGSPVFMMQLCTGARHIEVQVVGDVHGNVVALNGRDCSTQRRFQKIFEEGPPEIVPPSTFREMERAAQRLTQSIGYIGAGTVEYLYNSNDNKYYFLELNPRLQVEHPVTEEITQVNLPATQLQALMGIPLDRMPQIRRFYGRDEADTTSPIDFMTEDYPTPTSHVIAAHITAENPDDGFKPTSGKIERIKFQSSVTCWGYFSVGANGAIHEFADSQFGHIFARGKTREESRKTLNLALRQLEVVGEIRNPVGYLVELLNTDAFKQNTISTAWLDGLIAARTVKPNYDNLDVVFYAAIFRAMETLKAKERALLEDLAKSQLGLLRQVGGMNKFPIVITFDGQRYTMEVTRTGPDRLVLSINGSAIKAKVRTQADDSIFVSVGNSVMKVFGIEEALGLKLRLAGIGTIMLPTIYDPSELRSEFNGKVVRFLHDDGAAVKEGEPYVELEAMKMIMPIRASASGRVTHVKGAGSIVQAGELLAKLELDDPSSVQKIDDFEGSFDLAAMEGAPPEERSPSEKIMEILDGYAPTAAPTKLVQQLFAEMPVEEKPAAANAIIDRFLEVEKRFVDTSGQQTQDQVQLDLIAKGKDNLSEVVALSLAHSQLAVRSEIVLATIRCVRQMPTQFADQCSDGIHQLSELPTGAGYDQVVLLSQADLDSVDSVHFQESLDNLRKVMISTDSEIMSTWGANRAGVELLTELMGDSDAAVRKRALETYIRRVYRGAFKVSNLEVIDEGPWSITASWRFQYRDSIPDLEGAVVRQGFCAVVPELADVQKSLEGEIPMEKGNEELPLNVITYVVGNSFPALTDRNTFYSTDAGIGDITGNVQGWLQDAQEKLQAAGVRECSLMLPQAPNIPRYLSFCEGVGWKEEPTRRDMRPTFPLLLEVSSLAESYDLEHMMQVIDRNSQVYLGTEKGAESGKFGKPSTIFVRLIAHPNLRVASGDEWMTVPEALLLQGVDEIERVRLQGKGGKLSNSHIFLHLMVPVDLSPQELNVHFETCINRFVSKYGVRLQELRLDEIVVKVGVGQESIGRKETLRFTASSMTGEYLKPVGLIERHDPVTGRPVQWLDIDSGTERQLSNVPQRQMQRRRSMARRAGSTYAPEFLGMMKA